MPKDDVPVRTRRAKAPNGQAKKPASRIDTMPDSAWGKRERESYRLAAQKYFTDGDGTALRKVIPVQRWRFAEEYVKDWDRAKAYVRAGFSPNSADQGAYQLMQYESTKAAIDLATKEQASQISCVDKDYIVAGVLNLIHKDTANDGNKLRGYELLSRILGLLVNKTELTGKDGEAIEIDQRKQEDSAAFINAIKRMAERQEDEGTQVVELV